MCVAPRGVSRTARRVNAGRLRLLRHRPALTASVAVNAGRLGCARNRPALTGGRGPGTAATSEPALLAAGVDSEHAKAQPVAEVDLAGLERVQSPVG